jgi:cobyrinic acid a,c-diamide synthase
MMTDDELVMVLKSHAQMTRRCAQLGYVQIDRGEEPPTKPRSDDIKAWHQSVWSRLSQQDQETLAAQWAKEEAEWARWSGGRHPNGETTSKASSSKR